MAPGSAYDDRDGFIVALVSNAARSGRFEPNGRPAGPMDRGPGIIGCLASQMIRADRRGDYTNWILVWARPVKYKQGFT